MSAAQEGSLWLRSPIETAQALFQESGDAIVVVDPATLRIIDANPVVLKFTEMTHEDLVGSDMTDLLKSDEQKMGCFSTLLETGTFHSRAGFRLRTNRRDHWIPVSVTISRMHFSDAQPLGLFLIHDMREINEAKHRAERTADELQRVLQSVSDCVWNAILDPAGQLQYVYLSPVIERITGYDVAHFLDEPSVYREVVHPNHQSVYQDFVSRLRGNRSEQLEYQVRRADGESRWVSEHVNCSQAEGSHLTHLFGVLTDITSRKRSAERLRQKEAELAHFSRVSAMGEMAAALAHELNQPLYAIANFAGTAEKLLETGGDTTARLGDINRQISGQALRAGEIIRCLRAFVSKTKGVRSTVDVNAMVRDSHKLLLPVARDEGATVRLALAEAPLNVNVDQVQIQQVVVNLLTNAFESLRSKDAENRVVEIGTAMTEDGDVQVSIKDSGVGISRELVGKLFEPFFTTKESGMGMGMAISRTIIESHGGRIWATPGDECGTVACFTLPLHQGS
ncbi:MAG: PAS domain S-box protein [Pirellulaceae bacterium]|jgi:PAS domain S-box-containing protein|nr:PAS domain S-box protein [Pirellulaceae bacterium]